MDLSLTVGEPFVALLHSHSYLRTTLGASRDARHAGSPQAIAATTIIVTITAASVVTSVGCTPNSRDAITRFSANAAATPAMTPISGEQQTLRHDLCQHARSIRTERHANADLATPFCHHIREHAVGTDGGEQQPESCKRAEQLRQQPRPADRFRKHAVHITEPRR